MKFNDHKWYHNVYILKPRIFCLRVPKRGSGQNLINATEISPQVIANLKSPICSKSDSEETKFWSGGRKEQTINCNLRQLLGLKIKFSVGRSSAGRGKTSQGFSEQLFKFAIT